MAYPTTIPTFDTTAPGDPTTLPDHSALHNAVSTALSNVMTTLGTAVQGAAATVRQRFETIEANGWVTLARMAVNSVDSDQYVDGSIDTVHLADDVVTDAKIGAPTSGSLSGDEVRYARYGSLVFVWAVDDTTGGTLPVGFRPSKTVRSAAWANSAGGVVGYVTITTGGVIDVRTSAGSPVSGYFSAAFTV